MQVGAWLSAWAKTGLFTHVGGLGKELEQLAGGLVCTGKALRVRRRKCKSWWFVVADVSVCSTWAVAWAKRVAGCACRGRHGQGRS